MSLLDIPVKSEYRTFMDNIAADFYVPLLSSGVLYRRAVGFFSSSVLVQISRGVERLAANGGIIQIVASPHLSKSDIEAIRRGYERREEIVRGAVLRKLVEPKNEFEKHQLNLLANLVAAGILDIKIAFTENDKQAGMYHEKMGLISDSQGNVVAFSGSLNETKTALTLNYEAIDVFCSWKSESEAERVRTKEAAFTAIWEGVEPNIQTIAFPELREEIIRRYKTEGVEYGTGYSCATSVCEPPSPSYLVTPVSLNFHDYQIEAIDAWERAGFRGIFDMATGTGKTLTGLGAAARLCERLNGRLAVFIVAPFQHLVEQWVEDIEWFNINPIIGYSSSPQKNWLKRLEIAVRDQKLKIEGREFFCFICTNATFSSANIQRLIEKIRGDALLIADEAHNLGAAHLQKCLTETFNARLALSATIERHNDMEGTQILYDYFGSRCITYTLDRAIEEKKLTPYKYYPIITILNEDERQIYAELTIEMGKCLIMSKDGKYRLNEKGKMIALKRARLVAGIENKLTKLAQYIQPYVHDNHLLVYCGATTILQNNRDDSDTSDEDLRQIDAVTHLLGETMSMGVSQFTSKEDIAEREVLKREFAAGDNLQALIAIKCLDEGVNIPAIKTAFILASTTNPKEYIQRRGRVLRLYEGKEYAVIYDFIALPRPLDEVASITDEQVQREMTLVRNELARAEEFARIALNMGEAEQVIDAIKEAYEINNYEIKFEEDYSYAE
ncbi:MAG: DEAD/DEAH box helicase family protein [Lentisphaerae bacterium]|jgi:superfamily II DNA or RNA helicase|nr:DEAD/DEAH box helicase family protein [Lentisphaerota bacterium]